jgi:diacylglycerol kinase family enzyme
MPGDISYTLAGISMILGGKAWQKYIMEIDGERVEGDFISIMIANAPCYGLNMYPAIDAHPDDGILDIYVVRNLPMMTIFRYIPSYTHGNYRKLKNMVLHYRAKKIKLSSNEVMCMSVDGEHFYGTSIEYEVLPHAVQFVCPVGIDLAKLPRIYNRPREGLRGE